MFGVLRLRSEYLNLLHEKFGVCNGLHLLLLFQRRCRFGRLHGSKVFAGFQFVKLWFAGDAFFFVSFGLSSLSLKVCTPFPLIFGATRFFLLTGPTVWFLQNKTNTPVSDR